MSKVVFEEVPCKSLLNRVQGDALPFRWTVNPYRGCQHACIYCFARGTHEYLGYTQPRDFDTRIVVKVNAPDVLRQELRAPSWLGELVALGTACDPYEPAEQKYELSRRILQTLRDFANPVSITTKGVLVTRDIDVLQDLSARASCTVNISLAMVDEKIWKQMEPATPKPSKRLEAVEQLAKAGIRVGVLLAPIIPGLTDSPERLEEVVKAAADHGAHYLGSNVLYLKPGTREWYMPYLRETYPHLNPLYERLYQVVYAPDRYTEQVLDVVNGLRQRYGLDGRRTIAAPPSRGLQLALV